MSGTDPKKELQELQAAVLNIATDISEGLQEFHQRLLQLLKEMYKQNEQAKLLNVSSVMQGQPGALPNTETKQALDILNQKGIETNKNITTHELKLKQLQDKGISSPADVAQADALKRSLVDLSNQNAQVLKIQKELQKQALLTGELPPGTDVDMAKENLNTLIKDKLEPIYTQNKDLKAQIQAQHKLTSQEKEIKAQEAPIHETRRVGKVS